MLLMNPYYSCLSSYTKLIREVIDKNTNIEYKSYDKEKDNFVHYICFDLKSDIKLNDIFIKEIKYQGKLKFSFNKSTNEVFISSVPYVKYANVELPIFTSDIAKIIVELLNRYIPSDKIKIVFSNQLLPLVEDNDVVNIIPDMVNTRNHKILMVILENMRKEESKVMAETLRYKEQQARLHRSQERAIAQKRKMYGLDPKEFASVEEFINELTKKLKEIWSAQIAKIERHLKSSEVRYKNIIREGLKESDNATLDIKKLMEGYFFQLLKDVGCYYFDKSGKYYGMDREIEIFLEDHPNLDSKIKAVADVWNYFRDVEYEKASKKMIDAAVEFIYESDCHSEIGMMKAKNDLLKSGLIEEDISFYKEGNYFSGENTNYYSFSKKYIFYYYLLFENFGEGYPLLGYHPIFQEAYKKCCYFNQICDENSWGVSKAMERSKMDFSAFDLIIQIETLKSKLKYYKSLLICPDRAVTQIYQNSILWGRLMELPYWNRFYKDPFYGSGGDIFSLLMIQPGVTWVNLNNIVKFVDRPSYRKGTSKKVRNTAEDLKISNRLMVTIPNSLPIEELNRIIDYAYEHGKMLNFVCESIDTAIMVKKILISKALEAFKNGKTYFKYWCFVNIDPTYYKSFLASTPNNKVLWHKYDYSSDYSYRRKKLLSLDKQFKIALAYSKTDCSIDYQLLDEMLLGGYGEKPHNNVNFEEYERKIKEETERYVQKLKLSKKNKDSRISGVK